MITNVNIQNLYLLWPTTAGFVYVMQYYNVLDRKTNSRKKN